MKNNLWTKLAVIFFSAIMFMPTSIAQETARASGQETKKEEPYIEEYDAKGNLSKSYSSKEIELLMKEAKTSERLLNTEPKNTNESSYVHFYDENNLLIGSSNAKAVTAQQAALAKVKDAGYLVYRYDETTFGNSVTIASERYFKNPQSITVTPKQQVNALTIQTYKEGYSTPSGSIKIGNLRASVNVPLADIAQHALGSGNYKIQFIHNDTAGSMTYLNSGTLYYQ
ncbi:hypothetical protein ACH0BF_01550 [Pseudobacillus sp. 179-B 2D1 NHS]|uniref:hypothetical protein n=1 Tax=Pseudobacillus sp. 179-B 2D1 NHS TaxID=3374292 RepID=UPI0038791128